ncbi:hypothetical protein GF359_03495 [candidate division WOR-3 bacterium]|uniref:Uncharacterized protein n=1 Tax=candidate division WOR-3 bacterium TaxID=2052148 RepID=A0A9D5QC82_UNCW3|nr:hypothetical protein [candidate division WOR-3 bacterium]MBD3364259.1 hypothetical protein [candidate division WOR-3 bacterium]
MAKRVNAEELKRTKQSLREGGIKCGNYEGDTCKFLLVEYEKCHEKAIHYDRLSWIVGAFILGASSLVTALGLGLNGDDGLGTFLKRTPLAVLAIVLLVAWWLIYERNRGWVEILNERIKDIERALGIYGSGVYLSIGSQQRGMWRENLERISLAEKLKLQNGRGSAFRMGSWPMHLVVKLLVIVLSLLAFILWVFPLVKEYLFI